MSRRLVAALMLGIVLLLAGLACSWAQDVAAPWINDGEAQMGDSLTFTSGGGDYRVVTSGPARPAIEATGCTVVASNEEEQRVLGGEGVNPSDHLGVSRVLGFEVPPGRTELTCEDRVVSASAHGRYQVVPADGPVSIAVIVLFASGGVLLVVSVALLVRAFLRSPG